MNQWREYEDWCMIIGIIVVFFLLCLNMYSSFNILGTCLFMFFFYLQYLKHDHCYSFLSSQISIARRLTWDDLSIWVHWKSKTNLFQYVVPCTQYSFISSFSPSSVAVFNVPHIGNFKKSHIFPEGK